MGYLAEMQVFFERIAALRAGKPPAAEPPLLPPGDDAALAVDSVRVMYGAYASDERKGAEVELAELDRLAAR
jgi:hypothetical protein